MSEFKPITTQEEFDAAIKARLSREKDKYADYDQIKSRVTELETENVGLKSTIEANNQSKADADKQLEEMQSQIAGYETASLRTRIALQYGCLMILQIVCRGLMKKASKQMRSAWLGI